MPITAPGTSSSKAFRLLSAVVPRRRATAVVAIFFVAATGAGAADAPKTNILSCKDAQGRTLITDPSDRRCYTPPPTPDEMAKQEADHREQMERYLACKAAQRSDVTLLGRYPNRAVHDAARQKALDGLATQKRINEERIDQLQRDRKRLLEEAEFYPDGKLPAKLRRDLDSNSALLEARKQAIASVGAEQANVNKFYDDELGRLQKLWSPKPGDIRACVQPRIVKQPEAPR